MSKEDEMRKPSQSEQANKAKPGCKSSRRRDQGNKEASSGITSFKMINLLPGDIIYSITMGKQVAECTKSRIDKNYNQNMAIN